MVQRISGQTCNVSQKIAEKTAKKSPKTISEKEKLQALALLVHLFILY
jgi:hypothetical protein